MQSYLVRPPKKRYSYQGTKVPTRTAYAVPLAGAKARIPDLFQGLGFYGARPSHSNSGTIGIDMDPKIIAMVPCCYYLWVRPYNRRFRVQG